MLETNWKLILPAAFSLKTSPVLEEQQRLHDLAISLDAEVYNICYLLMAQNECFED